MSVLAVYDCMFYFRAASWPARVHPLMELVARGSVTPVLCAEVIAEIRDVVTDDNDLLELMDTSTAVGQDFRNRFPQVEVVKPGDFIAAAAGSP